jgi:hypothetical protein
MTVDHSLAERHATRVEAQVDELVRIIAAADEARWRHRSAADAWNAAEICGHIAEMLTFWANAAQAVAANPGVSFGRGEQDPGRLGGVARGAGLGPHEAVEQVRRTIRSLPDDAWQRQGVSITRGPMTVEQIIDRLLAAHLETHVEDVQRALG